MDTAELRAIPMWRCLCRGTFQIGRWASFICWYTMRQSLTSGVDLKTEICSPSVYKASVIKTGIQVRHLVSWFIQGIHYQKRAYTFTILYSFIQGFRYQNGHTCSPSCILLCTRHPLSKRAYTFAILRFALYEASVIKTGIQVRHLVSWLIQGIRYQNGHTRSPSSVSLYTRHPLSKRAYRFAILYPGWYKASVIKTGIHFHHPVFFYTRLPLSKRAYMFGVLYCACTLHPLSYTGPHGAPGDPQATRDTRSRDAGRRLQVGVSFGN